MPAPLSVDLRRRILTAWESKRLSPVELAEQFQVGSATVKRLIARYRQTGTIEPSPHAGGPRALVSEVQLRVVKRLLEANPDWTVQELVDAYNAEQKPAVSRSTMVRAVTRLGFTRKKSPLSPRNARPLELRRGARASASRSPASPLRVWFLWTKPVRTPR